MPKRTEYAQGTPNWVDLQTTDQSAAKQFYTSLFGWSYADQPMPDGGAVYAEATVNGETVAAIAPMPPGAPEGMPPRWNTYLAVDDVDASVDKVAPAGGQVLMQPFDIGDAGRMAVVADPTGAPVALWQANRHIGATLVNEPGALIWNELITDKPDSALPFYEAVVGLTSSTMEMAPGQNYTLLKAGGSDYPMNLLARAGVDLSQPDTVRAVSSELDRLVERPLAPDQPGGRVDAGHLGHHHPDVLVPLQHVAQRRSQQAEVGRGAGFDAARATAGS